MQFQFECVRKTASVNNLSKKLLSLFSIVGFLFFAGRASAAPFFKNNDSKKIMCMAVLTSLKSNVNVEGNDKKYFEAVYRAFHARLDLMVPGETQKNSPASLMIDSRLSYPQFMLRFAKMRVKEALDPQQELKIMNRSITLRGQEKIQEYLILLEALYETFHNLNAQTATQQQLNRDFQKIQLLLGLLIGYEVYDPNWHAPIIASVMAGATGFFRPAMDRLIDSMPNFKEELKLIHNFVHLAPKKEFLFYSRTISMPTVFLLENGKPDSPFIPTVQQIESMMRTWSLARGSNTWSSHQLRKVLKKGSNGMLPMTQDIHINYLFETAPDGEIEMHLKVTN